MVATDQYTAEVFPEPAPITAFIRQTNINSIHQDSYISEDNSINTKEEIKEKKSNQEESVVQEME